MGNERWASLLGLANRAGKVISGEELTVKEIRSGKAKLVLLAEDASENTSKKITDKCSSYGVPLRKVSDRYTLGHAIGKDARVVVAVMDEGFANKLRTMLDGSLWG
ncbi:YlxQ family RNA-binding protein [Geobacillus sp. 44B]|uniref:YlxQ family RNA-binding protein n=1 Tax=Saccharococcus caldoxylosilyticus TaxID=81408 RepID=UPI0009BD2470|nr:YlxQ family RNA-binding protein [Parageobacillus caldoxylosilyticus]OQP05387.1 50S ribosomal protein L7 [Geobacillus sp. 44B]QNU37730.1 YlxQ family RNA-binding protein [Geobacillus sp. 44B]BDG35182.1 50S ribosomal protein L7ae [Parageobacillus caldoxylosilyticus]BDG38957.1 50S ribosomal protein L7ae [Parageobacillus caldoxylosilyticus]